MKKFILAILALILCSGGKILAQNKTEVISYITGKIENRNSTDSVILMLNGPFTMYGGASEANASKIFTEKPDQNGVFKFKIRTENSPFHFTLFQSNKRLPSGNLISSGDVKNYLIEPGDSINVKFEGAKQTYSGRGAKLFEAQLKIAEVDPDDKQLMSSVHNYFNIDTKKWLNQKDSLLNAQLQVLNSCKTDMSPMAYGIIRADIIGKNRTFIYRRISFAGPFFVSGEPLKKEIQDLCIELQNRPAYLDKEDRSALTPEYILYLYNKIRTEVKYQRIINQIDPFIDENYFDAINSEYTGLVRDKLLTYWLTSIAAFNHLDEKYLSNALSVMVSPTFVQMVNNLKETFSSGQPVSDFDFQNAKGQRVRLSDFQGKVVVIDLWFTGCGPCLNVARGLRQVEKQFANRKDVKFVSISRDQNKSMWLNSIDQSQRSKPTSYFISNDTEYLYTSGTGANNSFIKRYVPQESYPCLLLIDKKGRIFTSTPSQPISVEGMEKLTLEINQAVSHQ